VSFLDTTEKNNFQKMIEGNPAISRAELTVQIGITPDGIKYYLDNLRKQGVLKRIGPDKVGYWEIVNALILSRVRG
jgi:ATP-dependent DNA helicase RecG